MHGLIFIFARRSCYLSTNHHDVYIRIFVVQTYPEKHIEKEEKILDTAANFCTILGHRYLIQNSQEQHTEVKKNQQYSQTFGVTRLLADSKQSQLVTSLLSEIFIAPPTKCDDITHAKRETLEVELELNITKTLIFQEKTRLLLLLVKDDPLTRIKIFKERREFYYFSNVTIFYFTTNDNHVIHVLTPWVKTSK